VSEPDNGENEAETPAAQNPTRSELIKVLASPLSRRRRNSAGEAPYTFLSFLNSPLPLLPLPFLLNSSPNYSKMAAVARSIRPFASRALAQKPVTPVCSAAAAFRFPRGTRSFSQSPLGELFCPQSWSMESPGALHMGLKLEFDSWDDIELDEVIDS
jgi:hypothetical protein